MIPKVIHYCWFGGNPLPEMARNCIESWKRYCPDYEIKEWNESNFDLECCDYVKEAYKCKKWAFVSDFARFWILYHEGGIYFDTDVELVASIDDVIKNGAFMGCERIGTAVLDGIVKKEELRKIDFIYAVNPGLGMATESEMDIIKEILNKYKTRHFLLNDGSLNLTTIVTYTSEVMYKYGWKPINKKQQVGGIIVYPKDYFGAMDYATGTVNMSPNTKTIHHYAATWKSETEKKYDILIQKLQKKFGYNIGKKIGRVIDFPYRVRKKIYQKGVVGTGKFIIDKILKNDYNKR